MARARRTTGAASVDFSDYDLARRWFAQQPREVAMTVRAALRVLPLIVRTRSAEGFTAATVLPVLS
jgi:hypothetical protein